MIYKRIGHWHLDVTIHGVRYREALDTTDRREASMLEKRRVSEIQQGKGASKRGREFARKAFGEAAIGYQEYRRGYVATRTVQFETERLKPLRSYFGETSLRRITAEQIGAYQSSRLEQGLSGRTINMEVGVLRRMLKQAKVWNTISEDVKSFPERVRNIGKAIPAEQKQRLFEVAASNPDWMVSHCAAVLAVSTTCRGVEIKNLRWRDLDLINGTVNINRSKTDAGYRTIPLSRDAKAALTSLWERAQLLGATDPTHFIFPACEHRKIDPTKPQKSFRTSWRKLTQSAGLAGFRFHDLRHQAITELAEGGASDATLMALAGHMSRRMLEHYSHVRMAAKRSAVDKLEGGSMTPTRTVKTNGKAKAAAVD